jgi:hypothetical protein
VQQRHRPDPPGRHNRPSGARDAVPGH